MRTVSEQLDAQLISSFKANKVTSQLTTADALIQLELTLGRNLAMTTLDETVALKSPLTTIHSKKGTELIDRAQGQKELFIAESLGSLLRWCSSALLRLLDV